MTDSATDTYLETASPTKRFPSFWASIAWAVAFFVLQGIFGAIAIIAVADGRAFEAVITDYKLIALPTMLATIVSGVLYVALLHLYLRKNDRYARIGLTGWSRMPLNKTLSLAVVLIGAGLAVNYLYTEFVIPGVKMQDQLRLLMSGMPDNALGKITLFTTVAIVAPITEELAFRGILQNGLKNWIPIWLAIPLSAMAFAAAHNDYYAFPVLTFMGMMFGILYYLTGSLRANIALHALNNAAALALS